MRRMTGARAYQASAAHRSLKEQEADVFRRVIAALRTAPPDNPVARTKALADTGLLWSTLIDTLRDPANALPAPLRGSLISLGLAVQREVNGREPDFDFLIRVNEQIATGLAEGQGAPAARPS